MYYTRPDRYIRSLTLKIREKNRKDKNVLKFIVLPMYIIVFPHNHHLVQHISSNAKTVSAFGLGNNCLVYCWSNCCPNFSVWNMWPFKTCRWSSTLCIIEEYRLQLTTRNMKVSNQNCMERAKRPRISGSPLISLFCLHYYILLLVTYYLLLSWDSSGANLFVIYRLKNVLEPFLTKRI